MESKKQFSKLGIMFLIGAIVTQFVGSYVVLGIAKVKPAWVEDPSISLLLSGVWTYFVGMPILMLLVKTVPANPPAPRKMKWYQWLIAFLMCLPIMYGSNIVGLLITAAIGVAKGSPVDNALLNTVMETNLWVNAFVMVILAPIIEELVFRKLIVDRTAKYGQGIAISMSALMFGLYHGNLNQFCYAMCLGGFLAFIYVKTGKIRYTIYIHTVVNFMGGVVLPLLVKYMNLEEYMRAVLSNSATGVVDGLNVVMENPLPWILYMIYIVLLLAACIAGLVLLIVFRKRFRLDKTENDIPKGERMKTIFLNAGMGLYCVFWIVIIVAQLFV